MLDQLTICAIATSPGMGAIAIQLLKLNKSAKIETEASILLILQPNF